MTSDVVLLPWRGTKHQAPENQETGHGCSLNSPSVSTCLDFAAKHTLNIVTPVAMQMYSNITCFFVYCKGVKELIMLKGRKFGTIDFIRRNKDLYLGFVCRTLQGAQFNDFPTEDYIEIQ